VGPPFPEHLHLRKMCGIVWCHTGGPDKAEAALLPIREMFPPALDLCGPIPHPALQSMFDPIYPPGLQWYWKADFINEISDAAIDLHHAACAGIAQYVLDRAPVSDKRRCFARR